jgi:hypothetical protein
MDRRLIDRRGDDDYFGYMRNHPPDQ